MILTKNPPMPGYFRVRAWSRGPWLPARISRTMMLEPWTGDLMDRAPVLMAFVQDTEVDIDRVWTYGREITETEYDELVKHIEDNPIGEPKNAERKYY